MYFATCGTPGDMLDLVAGVPDAKVFTGDCYLGQWRAAEQLADRFFVTAPGGGLEETRPEPAGTRDGGSASEPRPTTNWRSATRRCRPCSRRSSAPALTATTAPRSWASSSPRATGTRCWAATASTSTATRRCAPTADAPTATAAALRPRPGHRRLTGSRVVDVATKGVRITRTLPRRSATPRQRVMCPESMSVSARSDGGLPARGAARRVGPANIGHHGGCFGPLAA